MNAVSTHNISFQSRIAICLLLVARAVLAHGAKISSFLYDYDNTVRPGFEAGKPTIIRSRLHVESFGNIEEANMEYKVYGYFHQFWKDSRLAGMYNNRTLKLKGANIEKIWLPDPYCYNARESNMMIPNEQVHTSLRIEPSGDIFYSKGVTLLASCVMDLHEFPLDTQSCFLKFGSYGHSTEDIIYEWLPGETKALVGSKEMAQFEYKGSKLTSDIDVFTSGNFSTITVTFYFDRRIGYFLIQVYFPDIFVVVLSWIVFWMEKDDIGNRMTLGITTILTIMFLLGSLNGNLPKVSYPKALDMYLLVSFSFVFLSLIECLVVYLCSLRTNKEEENLKYKTKDIPLSKRIFSTLKALTGSMTDIGTPTPATYNQEGPKMESEEDHEVIYLASKANGTVVEDGSPNKNTVHKPSNKRAEMIDKASRILFPLAFIVYNIFYWNYY